MQSTASVVPTAPWQCKRVRLAPKRDETSEYCVVASSPRPGQHSTIQVALGAKFPAQPRSYASQDAQIQQHIANRNARREARKTLVKQHIAKDTGFESIVELLEDNTPIHPISKGPSLENSDRSYRKEDEDALVKLDLDNLEDAVNEITYSPPQTPVVVRSAFDLYQHRDAQQKFESKPANWTPRSFVAYVHASTESSPKLAQRQALNSSKYARGHVDTVSAELAMIFTDVNLLHYIPNEALDGCLKHLARRRYFEIIHDIFLHLNEQDYGFTAANLNTILSAAGEQRSIESFAYTLRQMLQRGYQPTHRTWIIVHKLAHQMFPDETKIVENVMRKKGLLTDPKTMQALALNGMVEDLITHLASGSDLPSFLNDYESRYGPRDLWLNTLTANKTARALVQRGRSDDAEMLIRQVEDSHRTDSGTWINADTVIKLLDPYLRNRDLEAAITHLHTFTAASRSTSSLNDSSKSALGTPIVQMSNLKILETPGQADTKEEDSRGFDILFELAWKRQCFNCLRVIWRYACASGHVTQQMRQHMTLSIDSVAPALQLGEGHTALQSPKGNSDGNSIRGGVQTEHPSLETRLWKAWAAKFAFRVYQHAQRYGPVADSGLSGNWFIPPIDKAKRERKAIIRSSQPTSIIAKGATVRRELMEVILNRDTTGGPSLKPKADFVDMLELAWKKDCDWSQNGLNLAEGLRDSGVFARMLKDGIQVPMALKKET